MTKLTDTQAILLSSAAQRADGSLLPPPETLGAVTDRMRKAVAMLIKRGLAEEIEVALAPRAWRTEQDHLFGAVITAAGRAAIGVDAATAADIAQEASESEEPDTIAATSNSAPRQTKSALVLNLLQRDAGATLTELIAATGWLPHTTRAALTGLRKKGHSIERGTRADATCYRIAQAA